MGISRAVWGLSGNAKSVWINMPLCWLRRGGGGERAEFLPRLWLSAAWAARLTLFGVCVCVWLWILP